MPKLLQMTSNGLYCSRAGVYIDPHRPVAKALITHAHSDHAIRGHDAYLTHKHGRHVMELRLGRINQQNVDYGEMLDLNGVKVSFHPSGHIIGAAQIRLEYGGEVWVVTGDYKNEDDGVCYPFEPLKCDYFITEATFGVPTFKWRPQAETFADLNNWWRQNQLEGKNSIIGAYSLGKAQRILQNVDHSLGKVFTQAVTTKTNDALVASGIKLLPYQDISEYESSIKKKPLILVTSISNKYGELDMFAPYSIGYASGWMLTKRSQARTDIDKGFVISDHCDWEGLNQTVAQVEAEHIYVTHSFGDVFEKWLRKCGKDANSLKTLV